MAVEGEEGKMGEGEGDWSGCFRPILAMLVTLPSGGAALLAASAACPLLIE
jgi:hypothetical protein